jgi:hypothetical protein
VSGHADRTVIGGGGRARPEERRQRRGLAGEFAERLRTLAASRRGALPVTRGAQLGDERSNVRLVYRLHDRIHRTANALF